MACALQPLKHFGQFPRIQINMRAQIIGQHARQIFLKTAACNMYQTFNRRIGAQGPAKRISHKSASG
jgi:hypothetical protein